MEIDDPRCVETAENLGRAMSSSGVDITSYRHVVDRIRCTLEALSQAREAEVTLNMHGARASELAEQGPET